ncbi:MAG: 3-deoxy-7-phosphoheptulonate synthase [Verrucomicrobia bacterium RIFCSPHIGHO2_12_FULL_41_10]|nr:MAG: 3-deoxy-7-phosphoheptulonate synthase [Verrucomicrobia bacterium RIFCSPHIGHO2_12_FULL_41_10]HLB33934.1 3-deoxy-7-phosphoheptulonate synthase [Chthoniobacterales bacterium]
MHCIDNTRVHEIVRLVTPCTIKEEAPATSKILAQVLEHRKTISKILRGEDQRLLIIVGPCSIHDPISAMDYAHRLAKLSQALKDRLFIVMRVYFEKPRTTIGWKGLISDPHLDDSADIDEGIKIARRLLLDVADLGLPAATEFLDPIIPQYIADLISWSAIGARTTESQTHREMASGLSMPVGFKNSTDGTVQTAIDAMRSSRASHSFLGIDQEGMTSIVKTMGNRDTHLVLRGGRSGINYQPHQITETVAQLRAANVPTAMIIDCSHANSGKEPTRQQKVWESLLAQRKAGCQEIIGAMIESYLERGNQPLNEDLSTLRYGVSITDPCLDWETTAQLLREA